MFGPGKKIILSILTIGCLMGGSVLFNTPVADAAINQGNFKHETGFSSDRLNQKQITGMFQIQLFNQQQPNQLHNRRKTNQLPNQQQLNLQANQHQSTELNNKLQFNQLPNRQENQLSFNIIAQVADILNIDEETIISELQDGLTLLEVAESYDVSESTLLEELGDILSDKFEAAVSTGILSEEKADEIQDQLVERLTQMIQSTFENTDTSCTDLSTPDDLSATAESDSEIELDWDSVSDATSYYVYRATSSSGAYSKIATVTSSSFSDTGLDDDTTYYYKVKAVNSSGTSAYSARVYATTDED